MKAPSTDQIEHRFRVLGWSLDEACFTAVGAKRRNGPNAARVVENLKGKLFGFLRVLRRGEPSKAGVARWWCHCEACDPRQLRPRLIEHGNLLRGISRSCGCKRVALMNASKRANEAAE